MIRRLPPLLLLAPTLAWGQQVKPRIMLDIDTSGSMLDDSCDVADVDNTAECAGADVSCAVCNVQGCGNGIADDSKLDKVKTAVNEVVNAFGEVEFGLARFHQTPTAPFMCKGGGWLGAAAICGGSDMGMGDNAADIVVEFAEDNQNELLSWIDGCDNYPTAGDCSAVSGLAGTGCSGLCPDCGNGCDKELRGTGGTPDAGSLFSVHDYLNTSVIPLDPAAACRPYGVILLTDGADNCIGDPETQAAALCGDGVPVYSIGFGTCPMGCNDPCFNDCPGSTCPTSATLPPDGCFNELTQPAACISDCTAGCQLFCQTNEIAELGCGPTCDTTPQGQVRCDGTPIVVDNETDLALAMADIAQSSVLRELCNGLDDNCNGLTDEGYPGLGQPCCDPCPGHIVCNGTQDGTFCQDDPPAGCPEVCNGLDDNCNFLVDEGIICTPETCNGIDDDGDGQTDELPLSDVGQPCGTDEGECMAGLTCCQGGAIRCCGATGPSQEICDCLDNNCNSATDEDVFRPCYNGPSNECPDPSSGQCVGLCQPGSQQCDPSGCPATNWGACVGEVGPRPENCDCLDEDCDGLIDATDANHNGVLDAGEEVRCPGDRPCVNCSCLNICDPLVEFPCPANYYCTGKCAGEAEPYVCKQDPCLVVTCGIGESCDSCTGTCVSLCQGVECGDLACCSGDCCETWQTCQDLDGDGLATCDDTSCTSPDHPCAAGEVCVDHACVPNPCADVHCTDSEFCLDGTCHPVCPECPDGQRCEAGVCVPDPCAQNSCVGTDVVCCGGTCINDPCATMHCPNGEYCDSCTGGTCREDPCGRIDCPSHYVCRRGECLTTTAAGIIEVSASGTGGCSCAVSAAPRDGGTGWWVAAGLLLLLGARRRARKVGLALAPLLLLVGGCQVRSLHFNENQDAAVAEPLPDAPGGECGHEALPELCNNFDDDCDGIVDDNLQDVAIGIPCGIEIGECKTGLTVCVGGQPTCVECTGDVVTPECTIKPKAEICNGLDDSCDGQTDEVFDFCNSTDTCGSCADKTTCNCPGDCPDNCGDGCCTGTENEGSCPADCPPRCGDGFCGTSENACRCPADCPASCGDGCCTTGETIAGCPGDCILGCGNGTCQGGENACNCPGDCPAMCGDDCCTGSEDEGTCAADCASSCGDGVCQSAEDACKCPADCPALCGDGCCTAGAETTATCPNDCPTSCGDGTCPGAVAGTAGNCSNIPQAVGECDSSACSGTDCGGCAVCRVSICKPGYVDCESNTSNGIDDDGDGLTDEGSGPANPINDCNCFCSAAPGPEVCDGIDNNCNGLTDEGVTSPNFCRQLGACAGAIPQCLGTMGWCCDYGPPTHPNVELEAATNPCGVQVVAEETKCDNIDGDCDGGTDEIFPDRGKACADSGVGACQGVGTYECNAAQDDTECVITTPGLTPQNELCDGKDNDCDGVTDENTDGPSGQPTCAGPPAGTCLGVSDALTSLAGNLRVYTYEASRPGSTDTVQGTPSNRACSVANVLPWSSVTWPQADAACANAGLRLCTASEWQTACQGASNFTWTYGNTYQPGTCNGNDFDTDTGIPGDQDNALPTGSPLLSGCVSQEGAHDMSGNVQEWTDDLVQAGCGDGACQAGVETACNCAFDCAASCGDGCCTGAESNASCPADCPANCGNGICSGETGCNCPADCPDNCGDGCCTGAENNGTCPADCPPVASHRGRGGAFDDPSGGLQCDNTFTALPDDWIHPNTGFRCCCTQGVDCPP
jgi:MYXO-CTERM domain-containing protein